MKGLKSATWFGAADFLTILANNFPVERMSDHFKAQLLINAVMSDCPETCRTVLSFTDTVSDEVFKDCNRKRKLKTNDSAFTK